MGRVVTIELRGGPKDGEVSDYEWHAESSNSGDHLKASTVTDEFQHHYRVILFESHDPLLGLDGLGFYMGAVASGGETV